VSIILWVFSQMTLNAQVWQWSTVVQNPARNKGTAKAYLWIPEKMQTSKRYCVGTAQYGRNIDSRKQNF
jgi:ABC-type dipeptide/oligopeptide/nickel transport system permease subunit